MKASELRIGNWINFDNMIGGRVNGADINGDFQVTPRFFTGSLEDKDFEINGYYKPIPLTEEWLLKLPKNLIYPNWIKYLHELQNWYYWNNEKKELHINL